MALTDDQKRTLSEIPSVGFHINTGGPCECGGENYRTTKTHGFSDSIVYRHKCQTCGNEFSTWIEG
jgi:hypothetical protein